MLFWGGFKIEKNSVYCVNHKHFYLSVLNLQDKYCCHCAVVEIQFLEGLKHCQNSIRSVLCMPRYSSSVNMLDFFYSRQKVKAYMY